MADLKIESRSFINGGIAHALTHKGKLYWKYKYLFFLLIPGICALLIFSYYPMYGIIIAFKDYRLGSGIFGSKWVGFKYFLDIIRLPGAGHAVLNSFLIGIYSFAVSFPATMLFALLLNEIKINGIKKRIQTISYLPNFISWVAVAGIVTSVLSPSYGIINKIIQIFGGEGVYFLVKPEYFRTIIVFSNLWKNIGWGSIVYLAMIANASIELYDAAIVDGAGRIKRALHVTIPAMYPIISIGLIFSLSGILHGGDFEQIFNLINSQTLEVGEVLSIYIYRVGLGGFEYSFATALGLMNTTIALLLVIIANKISSRMTDYALW